MGSVSDTTEQANIPPWTGIRDEAMLHLLNTFEDSWESSRCDICKALKWKRSPFCRRCCIKLQRAHLMSRFARLIKTDWLKWKLVVLRDTTKHWDLCRDYLLNATKQAKVSEDENG